jgi:hypothetical protein
MDAIHPEKMAETRIWYPSQGCQDNFWQRADGGALLTTG